MKRFLFLFNILSLLFICGCVNEESSTLKDRVEDNYFVSVQEYTGESYTLAKGEKTDEIAEKHSEEVNQAVKQYFKEEYTTEVKVHNIVGAVDGATVFVESIGNPHFYSYAIIPIDKKTETVDSDGVWSQEGQIGGAIVSGLYAWIYEDQFEKLDRYLEEKVEAYPVVGISEEANENGVGNYHTTPYFKVAIFGGVIEDKLLKAYMENPERTREEWIDMLDGETLNPAFIGILIQLYMEEPEVEPNNEIFDQIVTDLSDMDGLPTGKYSFLLHDNTVDKTNGQNNKDNTLERAAPDYIVKQ